MLQRAVSAVGGGGGITEVFNDTYAQLGNSLNTGCKLTDITLFYLHSTVYGDQHVMIKNDNGTLVVIGKGQYQGVSIDSDGYIIVANSSAAAKAQSAEAWGWV